MFIHIGNGNVIRSQEVIAIIDYQVVLTSSMMGEMVEAWKKKKAVVGPTKNVKSIMVTNDKIYYSSVSVSTLKKRASMIGTISNLDFLDEGLS